MKLYQKYTKLQRFYVTDCHKSFLSAFSSLITIQTHGTSPILGKHQKRFQKASPPTTVKIFQISFFDLKETCKVSPTKNCPA